MDSKVNQVNQNQLARLFAIAKEYGVTKQEIDAVVKSLGIERKRDIPSEKYEDVVEKIKTIPELNF